MLNKKLLSVLLISLLTLVAGQATAGRPSDSAAKIDRDVDAALKQLYATTPAARDLARHAKGILVFPTIVKAGFLAGVQYGGGGALRVNGRTVGYYNNVAGSYGFQAGIQSFGYAMFLMNDDALSYLDRSEGWEIGAGPSVVIVDEGAARSLTTATAQDSVYAFIFGQQGLMAGIGLQGSKITRIYP